MVLKKAWTLSAEKTLEGLTQKLDMYFNDLLPHEHSLGAGTTGVKVGDLNARYCDVTFGGVADTEATIAHGLGRIPIGYLVVQTDRATSVYDGGTAWTTTNIYLKSSVASAVVKFIFW